jgi:hypothetical protein
VKLIAVIAAALLTFVGGAAVYAAISEVAHLYAKADSQLKLGVITAFGSAIAFIINNAIQSSRERKAKLFESKRVAYENFFQLFFSMFHAQKMGTPLSEHEIFTEFHDFVKAVMVWGSSDTIKAVLEFQRVASGGLQAADGTALFSPVENLLRALRKDLGHSDASLKKLDLTKLIVRFEDHGILK